VSSPIAEEIKARVTISSYIQGDVPDLKEGRPGEWRGTCPIHNGSNPTELVVKDREGYFKCHSCGEGGDLIRWVELRDGVDFNGACTILAEFAGVKMPKSKTNEHKREEEYRAIQKVISTVVDFWHSQLDDTLREFMRNQYGLSDATLDLFKVGYAGKDLLKFIEGKGISLKDAKAAGLVIEDIQGDPIVPLARRIIFPWFKNGVPSYVNGRAVSVKQYGHPAALKDYETPNITGKSGKYVNQSVHSEAKKYVSKTVRQYLWGADDIAGASKILITEGIADGFAAWQNKDGLGEDWAVVSIATTTLKQADAKYIADNAKIGAEIVVCLDTDDAGKKGMISVGKQLARMGFVTKVFVLPDGEDIADFAKIEGEESLSLIRRDAEDFIPYWMMAIKKYDDPSTHAATVQRELLPTVAAMEPLQQEDALRYLSNVLDVPVAQLRQDMRRAIESSALGQADKAIAILEEHYRVIGHERTEGQADLILWSKKHGNLVRLPTVAIGKVPGMLSPDVDIISELNSITKIGKSKVGGLLRDAVFHLISTSPPMSRYQRIRSGMHIIDDRIVIVSGSRIVIKTKDNDWYEVTDPFITDVIIAECSDREPDWLEWSVEELNTPIREGYSPKEIYNLLRRAVGESWKLKNSNDANVIALIPFAYTWASLFPRRTLVHIRGPAGCGKTSLTFGLFGGAPLYKRMGGPFIVGSAYEENVTVAGVLSRYSYSARSLLFDEGDIAVVQPTKREQQVIEILSMLRNAAEAGVGILRGTADGGWRESTLHTGCIISSITPWETDQDVRRWLVIEPDRDEGFDPPAATLSNIWEKDGIDCKEMRRGILLAFQNNFLELGEVFESLFYGSLPNEKNVSESQRDNMLPILAVGKMIADNFDEVVNELFAAKGADEVVSKTTTIEERLIDAILNSPFEIGYNKMTTVYGYFKSEVVMTNDLAVRGVAIAEGVTPDGIKKLLWVNASSAQKIGPLKGTEFDKVSSRALVSVFKNHKALIGPPILKRARFGDVNLMWARFDWNMLMMMYEQGEVMDAPENDDQFDDDPFDEK